MKNLIITPRFLFAYLTIALFSFSCQVVETDTDLVKELVELEQRAKEEAFTFKGTVYEPVHRNCCFDEDLLSKPLANAKVLMPEYNLTTITDSEGNYAFKVPFQEFIAINGEDALYSNQEIRFEVHKEAYISSILTYDYLAFYKGQESTEYVKNIIDIDFPLTKRAASQMITPEGGNFRFGDIMVIVPKDAVLENIPLAVTALHPMEYKGKSYNDIAYGLQETELERIDVFPLAQKFEKPIKIAYEDKIFFAFDSIQVSLLNEAANNWEAYLSNYFSSNQVVRFPAKTGGTYMVKTLVSNHNCGLLYDEMTVVGQAEEVMSNCECGQATSIKTQQQKLSYEEIEFNQVVSPDKAVEIIRQLRRAANIPSSRSLCNFNGRKLVYDGTTDSESILLDKCSTATMVFDQRLRTIYGEVYGVHVVYQYYYTVDMDKQVSRCPTTSACHQGCPG